MTRTDRSRAFRYLGRMAVKSASDGTVDLSPESLDYLGEVLRRGREEYDRGERRRKARLSRNRDKQVSDRKLKYALGAGLLGGLGGAWAGMGTAAAFPLFWAGGALGSLGGYALGKMRGNDVADEMERLEDETGLDTDAQEAMSARSGGGIRVPGFGTVSVSRTGRAR